MSDAVPAADEGAGEGEGDVDGQQASARRAAARRAAERACTKAWRGCTITARMDSKLLARENWYSQ